MPFNSQRVAACVGDRLDSDTPRLRDINSPHSVCCVASLMSVSVFFFHPIVKKIWNKLPIRTDFTSINSFERALARF